MSAPSFNRVVEALERCGCMPASWNGSRQVMARCPSHTDHDPSLIVRHDGSKTLLFCFSGCDTEDDVLPALALHWQDLFDEPRSTRNGNSLTEKRDPEFFLPLRDRTWEKEKRASRSCRRGTRSRTRHPNRTGPGRAI